MSHGLILLLVGVPQALNRVDTSVSQAALFCTMKQPSTLRFTSFSEGLGTVCLKKKLNTGSGFFSLRSVLAS